MPAAERFPPLQSPGRDPPAAAAEPDRFDAARDRLDRDGLIDRSHVDYHVPKAAGGCPLVMTFGSASVDSSTEASYGWIALWDERNEPAPHTDRRRAPARRPRDLAGDADGPARHVGHFGHPAARAVGPARGRPLEVPVPLATGERPAIVERFAGVGSPARALRS